MSSAAQRLPILRPPSSGARKTALFQKRASTEVLARFSTVAGEAGSPDTWREVRGFSLKFYTDEGNHDQVVLDRAFGFWNRIDAETGMRIEAKVRSGTTAKPAEGMGQK